MHLAERDGGGKYTTPSQPSGSLPEKISLNVVEDENIRKNVPCAVSS